MLNPVFQRLFNHYPDIIQEMPVEFNSHRFIAQLAQEHQQEYIDALAVYRLSQAPFKVVHSILARHLDTYVPEVIQRIGGTIDPDIFGDPCSCATWQRVN